MARPAIYLKMRIETLERQIGLYIAKKDYNAADALRWVARNAGVKLDEDNIANAIDQIAKEIDRRRKADQQ